jgi:uncharacterized membrane protein
MTTSPLLLIHIAGATIGLLSGYMAMIFRKGSGLHGAAGTTFFVSMIAMSTTAAYVAAFERPIPINVVGALLTLYLVTTAWRAAKRREGKPDAFDMAAFVFVLADGVAAYALGIAVANGAIARHGIPAPVYFVFGTVALLCAVSDLRMFKRGGAFGPRRVARHLWRMCLALLIATLSFYPGQAKLFPRWLRDTNLLMVPAVLLIGSMLLHGLRNRRKRVAAMAAIPERA